MSPRCKPPLNQVDMMSPFQRWVYFSKHSPLSHQGFQCDSKTQVYSDHPLSHLGFKDSHATSLTPHRRRREQKERRRGGGAV